MKIMELKTLGVLLGLFHIIYAVPSMVYNTSYCHFFTYSMCAQPCLLAGYTENDPQPSSKLQESYILEEGEPSENFKEEEQEFLNKEMREEQVEVEEDSGKLQIMHTCTLLKWRC